MRITYFILLSAFLAVALGAYPVAIFHGFGDQCSNSGMAGFTAYISEKINAYAVCIEIGNGATDSITMNFHEQALKACESVKADPYLKGDISVLGLSQGALLARAIIEQCDFNGTGKKIKNTFTPLNFFFLLIIKLGDMFPSVVLKQESPNSPNALFRWSAGL
jgi:hypothetical protein